MCYIGPRVHHVILPGRVGTCSPTTSQAFESQRPAYWVAGLKALVALAAVLCFKQRKLHTSGGHPAYWRAELAGTRRHLLANSVQIHVHRHFNQNSKDLQLLAQYFSAVPSRTRNVFSLLPVSLLLLCSRALLVICFSFSALAIRLIFD